MLVFTGSMVFNGINLSSMDMSGGICITEALVLYDVNVSALVSHTEFARVQEKKNLSS